MSLDKQKQPETPSNKWRLELLAHLDLEQEPRRGFDSKDKKLIIANAGDKYVCIPKGESHGIISFYINKDGTLTGYYYPDKDSPDMILKSNDPKDLEEKNVILDRILAKYESEIRDFFTKKTKKITSDTEQEVIDTIEQIDGETLVIMAHSYLQLPLEAAGFKVGKIMSRGGIKPGEKLYYFNFSGETSHEIYDAGNTFGINKLVITFHKPMSEKTLAKLRKIFSATKLKLGQKILSNDSMDYYLIAFPEQEEADTMAWTRDI